MKTILFIGALRSGGAEHQMVIVARLLKIAGYNVTYLCGDGSSFFQKDLEDAAIPIIRLKNSELLNRLRLNTFNVIWQVSRILKEGRFDTVISFLSFWNYINCKFANKKTTKHRAITGIRNNRDEVFLNWRTKHYAKYEQYAYRKVSNSNAARIKCSQYYPQLADKLITIYNIVDLPQITTSYHVRKGNRVNVIVPASYRKVKNPMGLLNALALMSEEDRSRLHVDWYGNIMDNRTCYEEMIMFITDNHLENVVTLYDATSDIANRINEADVVGLFSTSEGLPNSICEGMMLGKPIVMTRVSDYEVLAGQGNGLLCDAESPQSIANALSLVAHLKEDEIERMGTISKEKAKLLFSKEAVINQWKEIV